MTHTAIPRPSRRRAAPQGRQRGIVLVFALIALIALTMAAIAFTRTVDTGAIVAGNLSFNRASAAISDIGLEAARTALSTISLDATCGVSPCVWKNTETTGKGPPNGYWAANQPAFDYRLGGAAGGAYNWTQSYLLNPATLPAVQQSALTGYTIRYIIHRMCGVSWSSDAAGNNGDPITADCVRDNVVLTGGAEKGSLDYGNLLNQQQQNTTTPYYRVTLRVEGPRNSIAYVQVWMI